MGINEKGVVAFLRMCGKGKGRRWHVTCGYGVFPLLIRLRLSGGNEWAGNWEAGEKSTLSIVNSPPSNLVISHYYT